MNVELTELTRKFGHTRAVAGVSLEAGPGVLGLLGPNGAGKTSLLRMMATVLPPSRRSVPEVGGSTVAIIRSSDVLPAPFGPSSPNTPGPASRFTPATARVRPNFRVSSVSSTFMLVLSVSGLPAGRWHRSTRPAPGRERQRQSR